LPVDLKDPWAPDHVPTSSDALQKYQIERSLRRLRFSQKTPRRLPKNRIVGHRREKCRWFPAGTHHARLWNAPSGLDVALDLSRITGVAPMTRVI